MASDQVKIAKIGEKIASTNTSKTVQVFQNEFFYDKSSYKLLIEIDMKKVIKDMNAVAAFKLREYSDGTVETLWLVFEPKLMEFRNRPSKYLRATKCLVEQFFVIEQENLFVDSDEIVIEDEAIVEAESAANENDDDLMDFEDDDASDDSDEMPVKIIDDLYQQLREGHRETGPVHNYTEEYIQHIELRPTLTHYQIDGVKWMLNRERIIDNFPTEFKEVIRRWPDLNTNTKFFYNERTIILLVDKNDDVPIPSGGILADAMGLGKTVEMLDLILLNPRPAIECAHNKQFIDLTQYEFDNDDSDFLRCLCTKKNLTDTVRCTRCCMLQHRSCVSQRDKPTTPDTQYICPTCWQKEEPLTAKTTFIVSPPSIKLQWRDEVIKHISDDNFKVLVYDGLKNSSWISPMELASYDIILTDYATLQSEFYYSNHNPSSRTLRRPARYLSVRTPLLFVNWWRVCLDEAQMVSSVITKPARLVAQLSAVHRWGVTGTPIQKSIDDLYGLICFLGCSPYDEREKWNELTNEFIHYANIKPIVSVLRKIMWRTCKSKEIMDQVNIPEQTELVHHIHMSDLENYYYSKEHAKCSQNFRANSMKIGAKQKLATLNPHMLKLVLEPLRKLRQDCSVPSIFERNLNQNKKNLKPDELLKHLMNKNEIEAKSELRTIAWSLNGAAALHLIKGENAEAIKLYRTVLKWAKDYSDKISVDTLLQIHAIHNLLDVDASIDDNETAAFHEDLNRLEAKYLEKYVTLVKNIHLDQTKWEERIKTIHSKLVSNEYQWWLNALKNEPHDSNQLLRRIIDEIKVSYGKKNDVPSALSDVMLQFQTMDGLIFVLTLWMDRVIEERKNVQKIFGNLRFYINNFKPITQIDPQHRGKVLKFLNQAYECHLKNKNKQEEEEEQGPRRKKKKKESCEMCLAKEQLKAYESVIVDHISNVKMIELENDVRKDVYSYKIPYQEAVLKIILSHIRNIDIEFKEDGKTLLHLLEAYRNESKDWSRLWVEVNYTVSAYDELKMCKSRTQAVDPIELEDESVMDSNLIISKYEVDENMMDLKGQLQQAELDFVRKLGQLKYLNHLKKNQTVEECPICDTRPETKYVVLECGHHVCMKCFLNWKRSMPKGNPTFRCHICRHTQNKHKVFYVTLQTELQLTDSSSKIETIVQHIAKLKKDDPTVKIVIFSQWSYILNVLEDALVQTNISFRSRLEKFYQTIKEFKDPDMDVTCLLLPLSYGSKGLNLIEATHVFFIEPILDTGEELQAIGRIHRMGQTKKTYVHRFIVLNTIEETIRTTISNDATGFWSSRKCTVENLMELFTATDLSMDDS
ncbi:E3 ubiquitin-protein ligase SHPRH [Sitodiplosis mosellana]|uniref:E3 ubiquitin-protein ligase SHPRH n=1 Tax=Sitodiplosis mosellana TaxID=263140 RepID=UPI002443DF49|nr:E3 ubiquitin-protein ligase SHPRH [Sitodiplosis mosellana]XP_055320164.1 E3 ubiquitin-protein ligase SHPRH [Sitodiplosis mosellana]